MDKLQTPRQDDPDDDDLGHDPDATEKATKINVATGEGFVLLDVGPARAALSPMNARKLARLLRSAAEKAARSGPKR